MIATPKPRLGHTFRNDEVQARFVKSAQGAIKICRSLSQVLLATEMLDNGPALGGL